MSDFMDYLHEVLADFGPITTRRMFGAHGIYRDGLMFGLLAQGCLYLKTCLIGVRQSSSWTTVHWPRLGRKALLTRHCAAKRPKTKAAASRRGGGRNQITLTTRGVLAIFSAHNLCGFYEHHLVRRRPNH